MKVLSGFIASAVAGLALGCSLPTDQPEDPASYFPMEADRVWEYRLEDMSGIGAPRSWPVVVRSQGPRFVPELGRVVAIFDEEYPGEIVPVAFFLAEGFLHSNIGLQYGRRERMSTLPIGIQPMRLMPMPPRIGMHWTYSEEIFGPDRGFPASFVIHWKGGVEARETVAVPAGRFERCLRIVSLAGHRTDGEREPHWYRYTDWYAPDVGLVKSEYSVGPQAGVISRLELKRFFRAAGSNAPAAQRLLMARAGR